MAYYCLMERAGRIALKYLHKGSLVYIEGRLRTRNWEDKDKNKRSITEIVGDNLVMLDKRKENEADLPKDDDSASFGMGMMNDSDMSL